MSTCDSNTSGQQAAQMRANFRIEDLFGEPEDLQLQRDYIAGKLELVDMLEAAKRFANRC